MALLSQTGTYTVTAGTGNKDITLASLGGTGKVAHFWAQSRGTSDGITTNRCNGYGVAVSSSSRATISASSRDNRGTSQANFRHDNTKCITVLDNVGGVIFAADFISFGVDTMRINVTTALAGLLLNFEVWGGDDLEDVALVEFQMNLGTGTQDITSISFGTPDGCILFGNLHTAPPATASHGKFCLSMYDGTDSHCVSVNSVSAVATSVDARIQKASAFTLLSNAATPAIIFDAAYDSLITDGVRIDITTADLAFYCWALLIKGPQVKVVTDTQPTTISSKSTDIGFPGAAGLLTTFMGVASAGVEDDARIGIGGLDSSGNQSFGGAVAEHGQATTDTDQVQDSNEVLLMIDHAQNVDARATGSFSGNNLALNWTAADAVARQWGGLVLGSAAAGNMRLVNGGLINRGLVNAGLSG